MFKILNETNANVKLNVEIRLKSVEMRCSQTANYALCISFDLYQTEKYDTIKLIQL